MSVIRRAVKMDKAPEIQEHFIGFPVASETTDLGLLSLIFNKLMELNIPLHDCRGLSSDNDEREEQRSSSKATSVFFSSLTKM